MRKLEGSKTEKNLITALEGEAFAHMKYAYYASQAKKDGFVEIDGTKIGSDGKYLTVNFCKRKGTW